MSAFICSQEMISNLIRYHVVKDRFSPTVYDGETSYDLRFDEGCQKLGQMLLDANYRSVNVRYRENEPIPFFEYKPAVVPWSTVQQLKNLRCLDYQSCEVSDWDKQRAYKALLYMLFSALNHLPGYDEAKCHEEDEDE